MYDSFFQDLRTACHQLGCPKKFTVNIKNRNWGKYPGFEFAFSEFLHLDSDAQDLDEKDLARLQQSLYSLEEVSHKQNLKLLGGWLKLSRDDSFINRTHEPIQNTMHVPEPASPVKSLSASSIITEGGPIPNSRIELQFDTPISNMLLENDSLSSELSKGGLSASGSSMSDSSNSSLSLSDLITTPLNRLSPVQIDSPPLQNNTTPFLIENSNHYDSLNKEIVPIENSLTPTPVQTGISSQHLSYDSLDDENVVETVRENGVDTVRERIIDNHIRFHERYDPFPDDFSVDLSEEDYSKLLKFETEQRVMLLEKLSDGVKGYGDLCGYTKPPSMGILSYSVRPMGGHGRVIWCKVRISFDHWQGVPFTSIRKDKKIPNPQDPEVIRNEFRSIVLKVFDELMSIAWNRFTIRVLFSHIDISSTQASMRCVFNGTFLGKPINRERELEVLNLAKTGSSVRSFYSCYLLKNLRELYLDYCPEIQKSKKDVFSFLESRDPIECLEVLSVVGLTEHVSDNWLTSIEKSCPKIHTIYFGKKKHSKVIGWQDIVMMQTMRNPQLVTCGHILDENTVKSVNNCPFDRIYLSPDDTIALNPAITKVKKTNDRWQAVIVDIMKEPLCDKTYYHPECGNFYNIQSLKEIFDINDIEDIKEPLQDRRCTICQNKMKSIRECYPNLSTSQLDDSFCDLNHIASYSNIEEDI